MERGGTEELDALSRSIVARVLDGEQRNQHELEVGFHPPHRTSRPARRDSSALLASRDEESIQVAAAARVVVSAGLARSSSPEANIAESVSAYIKTLSEKVAVGIEASKGLESESAGPRKRTSLLDSARTSLKQLTDTVFADLALEGHQGPQLREQQSMALGSVNAALANAAPDLAEGEREPAQLQLPASAPEPLPDVVRGCSPLASPREIKNDQVKLPVTYGATARSPGANLALDDFFSGKMVITPSAGVGKTASQNGASSLDVGDGQSARTSVSSEVPVARLSVSSPQNGWSGGARSPRANSFTLQDEVPSARGSFSSVVVEKALPEPDLIRWPAPDVPPDGPWTCMLCTRTNKREHHNCRVCGRPFGHEPQEYNEALGEMETKALHEERWTFLRESQATSLITSATWSPDGFLVATTDMDGYLKVWDVGEEDTEDWALLIVLDQPEDPFGTRPVMGDLTTVAWSPSGKFLAVGAGPRAKLWYVGADEPEKWRLVRSLAEHGAPVSFVSWAPDSLRLVSGDESGALAIWSLAEVDPNRWELQGRLEGHDGRVLSATWFRDGLTLVTAGSDRRVKRWRVAGEDPGRWGFDGELVQERDGRPWLAGALDEMWVVSSGLNKHLNVWFLGGADPKRWSCLKGFHG